MASLAGQEEAFNSTNGNANRQRLARLLICGGATLFREKLDSIHPLENLTLTSSDPDIRRLIEIDGHPSARMYFSMLLIILKLLKTTCGLTRPPAGWHTLPYCEDYSLEADLVRITYHCELEYWTYKDNDMSTDAEFDYLWREISETFLRIAGSISPEKRNEWQISIDGFLRDPLKLSEQKKYVEELRRWRLSAVARAVCKILAEIGDELESSLLGK